MLHGERSAKPSSRNQIQELLSLRELPARLAHGAPAESPWSVVEPHLVAARAGSSQDAEVVLPMSETTTPSGAQQPTQDEPSSAIVSRGGEHVKRLADPTVERKSRDQADAGSHACCQCLVRQSTLRDAQVAREMDTTTMHNVYVELPTEQGGASAKVKLGLRWESRPKRGRPRFTWGLRIKKQLQTVGQDLADAGADQVMADVAVVERTPTSSRG